MTEDEAPTTTETAAALPTDTPGPKTKNLGKRLYRQIRLGPETSLQANRIARAIPLPENSVYAVAIAMMAAQFAPLLEVSALSLDVLEDEVKSLFRAARRVIQASPVPRKKIDPAQKAPEETGA